jgi:predicted metal-binding membrane protein
LAVGFYVGVWAVMMAAMFPSVWPMVVALHVVDRPRRALGKTALPGSSALS